MPTEDQLHLLIRSLTKQEVRHLKSQVLERENEKPAYLKVFEAIEKMDAYDHQLLKKKLAKTIETEKLSYYKNYLLNFILEELEDFHRKSTIKLEVQHLKIQYEILQRRGLFKLGYKLLNKALKKAELHGENLLLYDLLNEKYKLIFYYSKELNISDEEMALVLSQRKQLSQRVVSLNDYMELVQIIHQEFQRIGRYRGSDNMSTVHKVMQHELIDRTPEGLSFWEKIYYYDILKHCYILLNEPTKALEQMEGMLATFEETPRMKELKVRNYVMCLSDYIARLGELNRYQESLLVLKKLKDLAFTDNHPVSIANDLAFERYTLLALQAYLCLGDKKNFFALAENSTPQLKDSREFGNYQMHIVIAFLISIAHYEKQNFTDALKMLNEVIVKSTENNRNDFILAAKVFELVIYFDMKSDFIGHKLRSLHYYLKQVRDSKLILEDILLKGIRNIVKEWKKKDQVVLFQEIREQLRKIEDNPREKGALDAFDITAWLDAKIEKKSYMDILRERNAG